MYMWLTVQGLEEQPVMKCFHCFEKTMISLRIKKSVILSLKTLWDLAARKCIIGLCRKCMFLYKLPVIFKIKS